jgi:hypothetical protein
MKELGSIELITKNLRERKVQCIKEHNSDRRFTATLAGQEVNSVLVQTVRLEDITGS